MNDRLSPLKFLTAYNKRGNTLKHLMPGQALAPQGFPGIVYIKRGGIRSCGKFRKLLPTPAGCGVFSHLSHIFVE